MITILHLDTLDCLPVEQVEQPAFLEIAFALEPFGPAVLRLVEVQQRQVGEQGGYLLSGGAPQVEIEADGLVDCLTNVLRKLIKLRTFEFEPEQIEMYFGPGNQQEGEEKVVGLAVIAAGDRLTVHAVDGTEDATEVVAAARTVVHCRGQLALVDGEELRKEISVETELEPFGSNRAVDIIEGLIPQA